MKRASRRNVWFAGAISIAVLAISLGGSSAAVGRAEEEGAPNEFARNESARAEIFAEPAPQDDVAIPEPHIGARAHEEFARTIFSGSAGETPDSPPLGTDFRQCSNDSQVAGQVFGKCFWIKSILQQNNSLYYEGMSVPQRLILTDIPATAGNTHTLTLKHQAVKNGIHAYDFITSWSQAKAAADAIAPGAGLLDDFKPCGNNLGPQATTALCNALLQSASTTVPVPDAMGTLNGANIDAKIAAYEIMFGERTITLFGDAAFAASSLAFTGFDTSGGSSYAEYSLSWTSASQNVALQFAGHLAVSGDGTGISYGAGLGSSNINGGPYHFKLEKLDGNSLGSQDNQIQGSDILIPSPPLQTGTIVVVKKTNPKNDPALFTFVGDAVGMIPDNGKIVVTLPPGIYTSTELPLAGWKLAKIKCSDENSFGDPQTGTATFMLEAEEEVRCVFENTKLAVIGGIKFRDANRNGMQDPGEAGIPGWTIYLGGPAPQTIVTGQNGAYSAFVMPGAYALCEETRPGWTQTSPQSGRPCEANVGYGFTVQAGRVIREFHFGNWPEEERTISFWQNWHRYGLYTEERLNLWLSVIDGFSLWLMNDWNAQLGISESFQPVVSGMVKLIKQSKTCAPSLKSCAAKKFKAQYTAALMNLFSGKKWVKSAYDVRALDPSHYLGLASPNHATLGDIILAIESKAVGVSGFSFSKNELDVMARVLELINLTHGY